MGGRGRIIKAERKKMLLRKKVEEKREEESGLTCPEYHAHTISGRQKLVKN
jgi:hypothetical protein